MNVTHEEAAELLGAYALDALDPAEQQAVDGHLAGCAPCRAEVADHREVAGLLTPGGSRPPAGLWERIAGSIEETPPPLDLASVRAMKAARSPERPAAPARRRRSFGPGIAAMVAVAAAAVIGVLGIQAVDDRRDNAGDVARGTHAEQLERSAEAALADPRARTVELASIDGSRRARAVVLPDGTGYLVDADLPTLSRERTYQLWAVVGASRISVGVLGPEPGTAPFKIEGDVSALAITEETAGGVETTRRDPVVVGRVQRA
ncbi:MAG: anti-sigma factor domain-containing protein [Acidimicrobiales bacterium]